MSIQVLDRLNALFESGGELVISERGLDSSGMFTLSSSHTLPINSRVLTRYIRSNLHHPPPPELSRFYGDEQRQRRGFSAHA